MSCSNRPFEAEQTELEVSGPWELIGAAKGRGKEMALLFQGADAEDLADQYKSPSKHQGPGGWCQGEDPEGAVVWGWSCLLCGVGREPT